MFARTYDRRIKMHRHQHLISGFIREIHAVPHDITREITRFTPIFKPHNMILFDGNREKQLTISYDEIFGRFITEEFQTRKPIVLQNRSVSVKDSNNKTILHQYNCNVFPDKSAQLTKIRRDIPLALQKEISQEYGMLGFDDISQQTCEFTMLENGLLDMIWEFYPDATITCSFQFKPNQLVLNFEKFLSLKEQLKILFCDDFRRKANVFYDNVFLVSQLYEYTIHGEIGCLRLCFMEIKLNSNRCRCEFSGLNLHKIMGWVTEISVLFGVEMTWDGKREISDDDYMRRSRRDHEPDIILEVGVRDVSGDVFEEVFEVWERIFWFMKNHFCEGAADFVAVIECLQGQDFLRE